MKKQIKRLFLFISSLTILLSLFTGLNISSSADSILPYLSYEVTNGEVMITECDKSISGNIKIPDKINGLPVKFIGVHAFSECNNITSVEIPEGVVEIYAFSFAYCINLNEVYLPESLITIGSGAFMGCYSLKKIYIPSSVTFIGDFAFKCCSSLSEVIIGCGIEEIYPDTFAECCKLSNVVIPKNVTNIGTNAFKGCSCLPTINYCGGKTDWLNIEIGENNEFLNSGQIKYNYVLEKIPDSDITTAESSVAEATTEKLTTAEPVTSEITTEKATTEQTVIYDPSTHQTTEEPNEKSTEQTTENSVYILNDVDGNGKLTTADARIALRAAANLEILEGVRFKAADVNNDGQITAADARMILRKAVGLE